MIGHPPDWLYSVPQMRFEVEESLPTSNPNPISRQGLGLLSVAQADDAGEPCVLPFPSGEVKCRERLGGLLRHYYREAA